MKTSRNLTHQITLDELVLSAEGFPANPTPQQVRDEGLPTIGIFGRRCFGLYERLAPVGSWQRTFTGYLIGNPAFNSMRVALTWKVQATKSSRPYFRLAALTHRTNGTECGSSHDGLIPTPCAIEPGTLCEVTDQGRRKSGDDSRSLNLGRQASMGMLPTPVAWDGNGGGARKIHANGLANELGYSLTLKDRAKAGILPTPTARCSKGGTDKERDPGQPSRAWELNHMISQDVGKPSQLNPRFVEEMMGFPVGWTESPFLDGEQKH